MDFTEVTNALGGGLSAGVIAGLSWACWTFLRWNRDDAKEHASVMRENSAQMIAAMRDNAEAIRALTEELKRHD